MDERSNADRSLTIVRQWADAAARTAGTTPDFFWTEMNYRALVPLLRAVLTSRYLGCGHRFDNERDVQIGYYEPPRSAPDWARLHARNTWLAYRSCTRTKAATPFAVWLDAQELDR
jgi:hypothetical protein